MVDVAGGIQFDPNFMANNANGAIVVAGLTYSNDFPVVNAFQSSMAGTSQAFLSVIDPKGTNCSLVSATAHRNCHCHRDCHRDFHCHRDAYHDGNRDRD